jgi:X-X-X-Leu-X-X-Gly heptad repeat protein
MAAATAIALGATSVASAGASFAQAAKQQRQMREAEEAAARYMDDARKKFSVNFAEQLQVPLEGYEMASDLNRQAVAQNIEALRESGQRAILGGVAGLQQQAQDGAEQLRMGMQQDLYERDRAIAAEESRLRDIQAEIDLGEAAGAQQAAADAQMMRAQSIQSGLGALASGATTLYEGSDLYSQSKETKLAEKFGKGLTADQKSALSDKFSNLSRGQMKFLGQQDPNSYSPFLQTPAALAQAQKTALGGIKKGALGQMPLPKITGR